MDQGQQHDTHGYGYPGSGSHGYQDGHTFHEYRPCYPPERREVYEHEPMVSPLAHTHSRHCTEGCGEVPNSHRGQNPGFATSSETLDKDYPSSGIMLRLGIPNGYGLPGWPYQENIQSSSQERGIAVVVQSKGGPLLQSGQPYTDSVSLYGSNTYWRPTRTIEDVSAPFNGALNPSYPSVSGTCANCENHPHVDGDSVPQSDQRDVTSTTDWRLHGPKNYYLRPTGESVLSDRQLPTQVTRCIASHNELPNVSGQEQSKSGFSFWRSAAFNSMKGPVNIHDTDYIASKGPNKERRKRTKTAKPRKQRTLTDEGKAHAKAVRKYPGGACNYCKRKKIKARDPPMADLVSTRL